MWLAFTILRVVVRTEFTAGSVTGRHSLKEFSFVFFGTDTEMNLTLWRKTGLVGRNLNHPVGKSFLRG